MPKPICVNCGAAYGQRWTTYNCEAIVTKPIDKKGLRK
jgi:hypothetical protein